MNTFFAIRRQILAFLSGTPISQSACSIDNVARGSMDSASFGGREKHLTDRTHPEDFSVHDGNFYRPRCYASGNSTMTRGILCASSMSFKGSVCSQSRTGLCACWTAHLIVLAQNCSMLSSFSGRMSAPLSYTSAHSPSDPVAAYFGLRQLVCCRTAAFVQTRRRAPKLSVQALKGAYGYAVTAKPANDKGQIE
eukprot:8371214-Pyramimonas_sp.AAC.1